MKYNFPIRTGVLVDSIYLAHPQSSVIFKFLIYYSLWTFNNIFLVLNTVFKYCWSELCFYEADDVFGSWAIFDDIHDHVDEYDNQCLNWKI